MNETSMKFSARCRPLARCLLLAALVLVGSVGSGLAQETDNPRAWAEEFLSVMIARGGDAANAFLKERSYLGQLKPDAIIGVREQMRYASASYGQGLGFELAAEKRVGESLLLLTYVVKYEAHPVVWKFAFYRPASHWNLQNFNFSDDLSELSYDYDQRS